MKQYTAFLLLASTSLASGCTSPVHEETANDQSGLDQARAARTYYVSSTTGADGNDGLSAARAWRTMAKVNSMTFAPGDVVHLHGTLTDQPVLNPGSGTSAAPITFVGDGPFNGRAVIDRIDITNAEHVVFRNLEASGAKQVLVALRISGQKPVRFVRFENLFLHDANTAVRVAGRTHSDITFVNTTIEGTWMDGVLLEDAAGDRFSFIGGSIKNTGNRGPVEHWNVHGVYASGGHGHLFDGVQFEDNANGASLSLRRGDTTVRNCRFKGGKMINNNNEDEGGAGSRNLTFRIYRNVFVGTGARGVGIYQGGNNDKGVDNPNNTWLVFNNTFVNANVDFGGATAKYYNVYLRNNAFVEANVVLDSPAAGRAHELSHNGWFASGAPRGIANITADPRVDGLGGVTAAAYRDKGTAVLSPRDTLLADGPHGAGFEGTAPDIGAPER